MSPNTPLPRLLRREELCDAFGISPSWLKRHATELPVIRLGRLTRFDPDDIARYLDSRKEHA